MDAMPASWTALCALAFLLGARHGFDADHLATIDGLTRCNARSDPALARRCGALFSVGHGVVVCAVAFGAASLAVGWQAPAWLEAAGATVSIAFLFGLAWLNLRAVLATDPRTVVAPVGIRSRLAGRVLTVRKPWAVAGIGALFALSFDTISQAALFAVAAGRFGGVAEALLVAALFVLGMLVVDGVNGAWIAQLIRRADRTAAVASRVMAVAVSALSLSIGVLAVAKLLFPAVDAWAEGRALAVGTTVVLGVLTAFAFAMLAARRRAAAPIRS